MKYVREDAIEKDLVCVITKCYLRLKEKFYKENKIEEYEEDTRPDILSKRDTIESLPPPLIKVMEIINDSFESKNKKGFLFKYDYTVGKEDKIEFCGSISTKDNEFEETIHKKFNLSKKQNFLDYIIEFTNFATWEQNEDWVVHFVPGDIINQPDIFYREWEKWVLWNHGAPVISERFKRERFEKFNEMYKLKNDTILSAEEITKPNPQVKAFGLELESIQKSIADIQLIPKVPDDIRRVFNKVKKLFMYGYFEYEFFTIAEHYAYLALEAAIKTRYMESLKNPLVLTVPSKNLTSEMQKRTHYDIVEFCISTKGWDAKSVLVNGKKFPHNGVGLLDWLEENHLIRKWEKGIFEAGLYLRNSYSHQERHSITMPNSRILHVIADEINYIFHKEIMRI
ncbi:MAG: hypothetical protein K5798_09530 [Nitrosopumilus sp.]|uniref:hypothetical protein n=1 Tax=Nitrosopumilus sp. TaxID=2024843 RepID=UPI00242F4A4A|nr:hypothetical protein [Nitrosopumilus sp.]MCV0367484.1 hypothetical protein [Nitrosopumilus sp.]